MKQKMMYKNKSTYILSTFIFIPSINIGKK